MRKAVRAIIIRNDEILVMHRNKFGTEYDTLPGGNIEVGEQPEQALYRELMEETGVVFENPRLVLLEHSDVMYGDQYIYLCSYVSGEPKLADDSEEQLINKLGSNLYDPMWIKLSDLPQRPFVSHQLRDNILTCLKDGWPDSVKEFSGTRSV